MKRRDFLKISLGSALGITLTPPRLLLAATEPPPLFDISLAEWSLVKSLRAGTFTNLDFPRVARREFDIDCVEFVDQFFADKANDKAYLTDLKQRGADEGVKLGLIMIDTTGDLGAAAKPARDRAVLSTFAWIDAARFLGCHTIRINARGPQNREQLLDHIVESGQRLADHAGDLKVVIENHGGLSSDPDWLVSVFQAVGRPNFGALPDFGNFPGEINRYDAVEKLMPHAKAVSAKATRFSPEGRIVDTDFPRMMRIVRDGGYHGHVGVESSADSQEEESSAIRHTRDALKAIRQQQARCHPIFNGKDLAGWTSIGNASWSVQNGVIVGKDGSGWSHNPDVAGTWLSSETQYADFRFEFQYAINKGGNGGVFFRSSRDKNPAFNGYEFQIYDAPGTAPTKNGPGSIYDKVAPSRNLTRGAGEWNSVTLIAKGPEIVVEINGEEVIRTELDQSLKGYLGLQVHDEKSEVRFRNLRVEEL